MHSKLHNRHIRELFALDAYPFRNRETADDLAFLEWNWRKGGAVGWAGSVQCHWIAQRYPVEAAILEATLRKGRELNDAEFMDAVHRGLARLDRNKKRVKTFWSGQLDRLNREAHWPHRRSA